MTCEDHVAQDIKVGVGKGRVGPPRNEDVRRVIRGRQQESVFDPAIPCPVDRGPHDVIDASDRSEVERSLNHVSLELFHVPGAVDFEVSPELEQAPVGDEQGAPLHRKDDERPFVGFEMRAEQGEPVRIPFRGPCRAEKCDVVESVRVLHPTADGHAGDEGSCLDQSMGQP